MRFKFVFCSKRMKTIQTKKNTNIPLNNADNFFTARYCYPSAFGIIKIIFFFHDLSCVLKCREDIYSFFLHITH